MYFSSDICAASLSFARSMSTAGLFSADASDPGGSREESCGAKDPERRRVRKILKSRTFSGG